MNPKRTLFFASLMLALLTTLFLPASAQKPAGETKRVEPAVKAAPPTPAASKPTKATMPAKPAKPTKPATSSSGSTLAKVTGMQVARAGDSLRIALDVQGAVTVDLSRLSNPSRLFVDLTPARVSGSVTGAKVGELGVARVRIGQHSDNNARVVLDLTGAVKQRLTREDGQIVLWIDPVQPPKTAKATPPAPKPAPVSPDANPPAGDQTPSGTPQPPAQVSDVSTELTGTGVRVKIAISRLARVSPLLLQNPTRLAIDIPDAVLTAGEATTAVSTPLVTQIRTGQTTTPSNMARVVLDLTGRVSYNVSYGLNEILIDLRGLALRQPRKVAGTRITIDPGHGGYQPGARAFGVEEKDINLAIAKKVNALLNEMGAISSLTRNDDSYVSLDDRVAIAERHGADLFISFHCNSCGVTNSRCGTELYYYTDQSRELASILEKKLVAALGTRNGGVFQRRFLVVRKSSIPAVLVEVGYINHSGDVAKLSDANFQRRVARAVAEGVTAYLRDDSAVVPGIQPPAETPPSSPEAATPETPTAPKQEEVTKPDEKSE